MVDELLVQWMMKSPMGERPMDVVFRGWLAMLWVCYAMQMICYANAMLMSRPKLQLVKGSVR